MRFNDAPCNPATSFHHRRPLCGTVYRYLGLVCLAITTLVVLRGGVGGLGLCLGGAGLLWLAAWWQQVGNRYRAFLVATMWLAAVALTALRLEAA